MRNRDAALIPVLALLVPLACQPADNDREETAAEPPVVEVTAVDYAFVAPDTIPSGWVTFRLENRGEELHVFDLLRLPEGKRYEDLRREYLLPADTIFPAYQQGEIGVKGLLARLDGIEPDWMAEMTVGQGVGLTSPGRVARTTVKLEPGRYYMKCFVTTERPDGMNRPMIHWALGMRRPVVVKESAGEQNAPEADIPVTADHYAIQMADTVEAGRRTFAIRFGERSASGEAPYQDLHLVRLTDETTVEEMTKWTAGAFDAPAPGEFLGGAHAAPAGRTAYVTAELEPGRYVWISAATAEKGMVKEFTVE